MMTTGTSSDKMSKNNKNSNKNDNDNNEQPPKQKKAKSEDTVVVEAVEEEDEEEYIDTYVVVTETYPTTYGANRGTTYDRGRMIALTNVDVTQDFNTREEALDHGIKLRDDSEWFTDHECSDVVKYENDPPCWDSAKMKNYDNDEEVRIQIMTTMDYDDWAYENQLYLENKQREQRRKHKIEERM
jgi:hypothetical protein